MSNNADHMRYAEMESLTSSPFEASEDENVSLASVVEALSEATIAVERLVEENERLYAMLDRYATSIDAFIALAPQITSTLDIWQERCLALQAELDAIELLLDREDAPRASPLPERLERLLGDNVDRRRKPKVPCSRCGKRPAASKGLCRSCYNSAWEARKRKANEFSQAP